MHFSAEGNFAVADAEQSAQSQPPGLGAHVSGQKWQALPTFLSRNGESHACRRSVAYSTWTLCSLSMLRKRSTLHGVVSIVKALDVHRVTLVDHTD